MNKQELIEKIEDLKDLKELFGDDPNHIEIDTVIRLISKLDEPQPLKPKDVIKRIEGLNLGSQKIWLDEILNELGSDYGSVKYKDGYEQGKLEGEWVGQQLKDADKIRKELNKPVVPQFVADWIEECKNDDFHLFGAMEDISSNQKKLDYWFREDDNMELFARAWLDGYEVEKEKRYIVKIKGISEDSDCLNYDSIDDEWYFASDIDGCNVRTHHTREQLEKAGFGWVFDCPGVEVWEVEE